MRTIDKFDQRVESTTRAGCCTSKFVDDHPFEFEREKKRES
jgi:hypothetical protein